MLITLTFTKLNPCKWDLGLQNGKGILLVCIKAENIGFLYKASEAADNW